MYAHSPCVSQVGSQRVNIVPMFFFAKEVSTVLSQWLSSTPPERKRIPRKPTEASYSPSLRLSTQTFSPNANSLALCSNLQHKSLEGRDACAERWNISKSEG